MIKRIALLCALLLSLACADSPNANNTFFTNPSNSSFAPTVWQIGTTQIIRWNTTASPISLDLYQYIPETKSYESGYIFEDYSNITEFAWEVAIVEPFDSNGEANFHLKLVPPSYNGLPDEGVNSGPFTVKNTTNSSTSSLKSSMFSTTISSTTSSAATSSLVTTTNIPTTTTTASSASTASSSKLSSSTRLGLGIGLGIGLTAFILLSALAIIWYVRKRHVRQPLRAAENTQDTYHDAQPGLDLTQFSTWSQAPNTIAEMGNTPRMREMDGNGLKAELSAGTWRERGEGIGELDSNGVSSELSASRRKTKR